MAAELICSGCVLNCILLLYAVNFLDQILESVEYKSFF